MFKRALQAFVAGLFLTQSAFSATQSSVVPFNSLRIRLGLQPGQTYLSFMQKQVKPSLDWYENVIEGDPATRSHDYRQLQSNLIAKGAGVAILINNQNYIFNVGYLNGSNPSDDVKSGRSYGVGPTGRQSDPSDLAYLKELEAYLHTEPQSAGAFIETLMRVITNCDTSGWPHLSAAGQIVATDFLAIYTAELDRHLMVGLNPKAHPWEIDLAAATFVSIFNASSGLLMRNSTLVPGSIQQWWAQGSQGSGIGETRRDRIALQQLIAREEANSAEVQGLQSVIGHRPDGDVIQGTLEYLNSPAAPPSFSGAQLEELTYMMRDYLLHVQAHASQIASFR